MNTVSIGYHRDDEDFAILATLNNSDDHVTESGQFEAMCEAVRLLWQAVLPDEDVVILERQDAPDYVDIEEDAA